MKNPNRKRVLINNNISYFSDGWDELFLQRIQEKYGLHIDVIDIS